MKPAPIDEYGNPHCGCGGVRLLERLRERLVWVFATGSGVIAVNHCPDCGRALGFDSDGQPVVGDSPAEIEAELGTYRRMCARCGLAITHSGGYPAIRTINAPLAATAEEEQP